MNNAIQELIDVWENRPRRQLDYSGLTDASLADLEWTNRIIKALIPAVPDIRLKFGQEPTPPIVLQVPLPPATPPTPATPVPAADAPIPSTPDLKGPALASSTGTQGKASPRGRSASNSRRKGGSGDKFSSADSKRALERQDAKTPAPASPPPPAMNLTDPPVPSMTEIG